jgi:hypothetical protein
MASITHVAGVAVLVTASSTTTAVITAIIITAVTAVVVLKWLQFKLWRVTPMVTRPVYSRQ